MILIGFKGEGKGGKTLCGDQTRQSVSVQFMLVVLQDTVRGRKNTAKICNINFLW